jgi:hypothetical protein
MNTGEIKQAVAVSLLLLSLFLGLVLAIEHNRQGDWKKGLTFEIANFSSDSLNVSVGAQLKDENTIAIIIRNGKQFPPIADPFKLNFLNETEEKK